MSKRLIFRMYEDPAPEGQAAGDKKVADPPKEKLFKQEEVNSLLATERRKAEDKSRQERGDQLAELQKLQQSQTLSAQEKESLAGRVKTLEESLLTTEQKAAREQKRLQDEAEKAQKALSTERDSWKSRFEQHQIARDITDAAVDGDAFVPAQVLAELNSLASLEELPDQKGIFATVIRFPDVDKENKPIVVKLSVKDAVKRMKELPQRYGNLFKGLVVGGIGGGGNAVSPGAITQEMLTDPELYRKHRDTILKKVGG